MGPTYCMYDCTITGNFSIMTSEEKVDISVGNFGW